MSDPGYYPPMPGEPPREPAVAGAPPPPVANAVKLMFARAALSVLGLLALAGGGSGLKDQIRKAQPSYSSSQVDSAATTAVTVGIIAGIIVLVLYVLLALQVRKGKSWARITTMVLALLSLLSGLLSLGQPVSGLNRALGVVGLIIDAAVLVLLALRPSAEYFRRTA